MFSTTAAPIEPIERPTPLADETRYREGTHLSARVHFDGDAAPFGEYTWRDAEWRARFTSGGCDPAVMELPPERCSDGMPMPGSYY